MSMNLEERPRDYKWVVVPCSPTCLRMVPFGSEAVWVA